MKEPSDRLGDLPELEVPADLDALVFQRACQELESTQSEKATAVVIPRSEALVYAAGLAAYSAYLLRAVHGAVQGVFRLFTG